MVGRVIEILRRQRWRLALLLFCSLLAVAYTWPHFQGLRSASGGLDWSQFQVYNELTYRSVVEHGQIPYYHPFICGGAPHIGNPQTDLLSPWVVFTLISPQAQLRLFAWGHLVIAILGMYWWARRRELELVPALGAGLAFGLSGFFAAHIAWGHPTFLPIAYLPLVMVAYEKARERWEASIALGALGALMLLEGGTYPVPFTLLLLAARVVIDVARRPRLLPRLLFVGLVAGVVGVGLSAPKLLPTLIYQLSHERTLRTRDSLVLSQLLQIFLSRDTSQRAAGFVFNRYEYFNYMGPVVFAAALWGLWCARRDPFREIYILIGLFLLVTLGRHGPWSPYEWMLKIPPYEGMRVPSRYAVIVGMYFALVFGYALSALWSWLGRRSADPRWRWLTLLPIAFVVVDAFLVTQGMFKHNRFDRPVVAREQRAFRWLEGGGDQQYFRLMREEGSAGCFDGMHIPRARGLRLDTTDMAWYGPGVDGEVELRLFSPNRLELDVESAQSGRLLINQNAQDGWRVLSPQGAKLAKSRGQLAVELPAGAHRVVLSFVAPGFHTGVALFAGTIGLVGAALGISRWRRRATGS